MSLVMSTRVYDISKSAATLLLGLIAAALPLHALDAKSDPIEAFNGEYIVTVREVLENRVVNAIQGISDEDVEVVEERSGSAILIAVGDSAEQDGAVVPIDQMDLCKDIKREVREHLQDVREDNATPEVAILRLKQTSCEPNFKVKAEAFPNDTYWSLLWGLHQSNDIDMDAPEAWDRSTGSPGVVVAVIDTGITPGHPDLKDNLWVNTLEVAGDGIDNDGNGIVDDVNGYNPINETGNPADDHGHGTHVSGTIAGRGNNGQGVVGVVHHAKIMGLKFLNSKGSGAIYDAIQATDYITAMKLRGVNVVASNNSWGGGGYSSAMRDAIERAKNAGVLFIAAAGNSGGNNDSSPQYPASYDNENIISVAAADKNGAKAGFSCYGATSVDVAAPGVGIASTYINNTYTYMDGTSMATPQVSGLAVLLKAYNKTLSWSDIKRIILQSVTPLAGFSGVVATGGMVNAERALSFTTSNPTGDGDSDGGSPTPTPTPVPTATPTPVPTPVPTATPTPAPVPYNIFVKVRDADGVPIAGAEVRVSYGDVVDTRYTSSDGILRFNQILGPINYTINVAKAGYTFGEASGNLNRHVSYEFIAGIPRHLLTVKLVHAISQVPLPGRTLVVAGVRYTSDSRGMVQIDLPEGEYNIVLDALEYKQQNGKEMRMLLGDTIRVVAATYLPY